MFNNRELNEEEAVTACETIGDTPVYGIFEGERLVAVVLDYGAEASDALVAKLNRV
jgi:hypothetical protein